MTKLKPRFRTIALSLAIAPFVLVAACSTRPTQPPAPPAVRPTPTEVALSPADYVREASSISLFAIKASQLVAGRNVGVTSAARTIEQEQGVIAAQLSFAGRRVNLLPSADILPEHEAMLATLDASADPANLYREQMRIVLSRGASIHGAFARGGASATLRPVAEMSVPIFQRELRLVR